MSKSAKSLQSMLGVQIQPAYLAARPNAFLQSQQDAGAIYGGGLLASDTAGEFKIKGLKSFDVTPQLAAALASQISSLPDAAKYDVANLKADDLAGHLRISQSTASGAIALPFQENASGAGEASFLFGRSWKAIGSKAWRDEIKKLASKGDLAGLNLALRAAAAVGLKSALREDGLSVSGKSVDGDLSRLGSLTSVAQAYGQYHIVTAEKARLGQLAQARLVAVNPAFSDAQRRGALDNFAATGRASLKGLLLPGQNAARMLKGQTGYPRFDAAGNAQKFGGSCLVNGEPVYTAGVGNHIRVSPRTSKSGTEYCGPLGLVNPDRKYNSKTSPRFSGAKKGMTLSQHFAALQAAGVDLGVHADMKERAAAKNAGFSPRFAAYVRGQGQAAGLANAQSAFAGAKAARKASHDPSSLFGGASSSSSSSAAPRRMAAASVKTAPFGGLSQSELEAFMAGQ
jgi:hypothetical protein